MYTGFFDQEQRVKGEVTCHADEIGTNPSRANKLRYPNNDGHVRSGLSN